MSKNIKLICLVFLIQATYLQAQIEPPAFLCIKNDTLVWETPTNPCGPFVGYEVYFSESFAGPYSLLTTITDPSVTTFNHDNPAGDIRFYYLQSNFDCPGEPVLTSDTLDNRIPEAGPIQSVSVINGDQVQIDWAPSPSPEVFAYIISRNTQTGTTVIDTVYGTNTYIDTTAAPDEMSEVYFVVALDPCGNTSLVGMPHNTILLSSTEADPCERSITLSWNAYQNWPNGVGSYQILVSVNGEPETVAATIDGNMTSYVFENVGNQDEYCFRVNALEAGTDNMATSTQTCETPEVIQGVRDFLLTNASVTENNEVELTWVWDPTAALSDLDIQSAIESNNFSSINNPPPTFPLEMENSYLDNTNDPSASPVIYQLETTDECDLVLNSNALTTLFLQGQSTDGGNNFLEWIDQGPNAGITEAYEVYRITGGTAELLSTTSTDILSLNDQVDITDPQEAAACYYVVAVSKIVLFDGTEQTIRSRSNTLCLQQRAEVYVPNAFVPDGINKTFFPVIQFGDPAEYLLVIYDRYGGKLFESQSIENGWDGKSSNGRLMPQDVYAYYIRVVQAGGQVVEKRGNVLLLR